MPETHAAPLLSTAVSRTRGLIAGFGVQTLLFLLWIGLLLLLVRGVLAPVLGHEPLVVQVAVGWLLPGSLGLTPPTVTVGAAAPPHAQAMAILVVCLCLLPKVLTFCVGLALLQRGLDRVRYDFLPGPRPPGDDLHWDEAQVRVFVEWEFEQRRAHEGLQRVLPYGGFYGFVTSAILTTVVLLLCEHLDDPTGLRRCAVALVVAAATATSFVVNLGRILLRVAHRDASPRMFAWATRSLLLVVIGAVLGGVLLLGDKNEGAAAVLKTPTGAVLLGMVVALFGERALQLFTDRAAQALGLPAGRPPAAAELLKISGLSEADIERLAEEGVDSLHALAYCTTPRLYFQTTFSLERICDWQDQALLFTQAGQKATLLREQFLVLGASEAQALAERLLVGLPAPPPPAPPVPAVDEPRATLAMNECAPAASASPPPAAGLLTGPMTATDCDMVVKLLGFGTYAQAHVALAVLADDERARRLRVYRTGSVRRCTVAAESQ